MKKIIISVLAIIIISGGAFAAKSAIIDKPSDPQAFVNQAIVSYFDIDSVAVESVMNLSVSGLADGAGSLNLKFTGKANNLQDYLPEVDYQIMINGGGSGMGSDATVTLAGDLRILDEVFYGRLGKVELTGLPNQALAAVGMANTFAGKWYGLSFKKLKEADPQIEELFEEQKRQQLVMRTELKSFLTANNIFLVESMPLSFGGSQKVNVVLNADVLTSDAFFAVIEKMLTPSLPEGAENPFALDEEKRALAKGVIRTIAESSRGALEIGKKDGTIQRETVAINLNLADLGIPEAPTGNVNITVDSRLTDINKPQNIEAPAEFEEIDPLDYIPTPTTEETDTSPTDTPPEVLETTE
jgi:hypothetical protein